MSSKKVERNVMLELAKNYYEFHGDINMPVDFKTIYGYEYDNEGVNLYNWVNNQHQKICYKYAYKVFLK